MSLSNVAKIQDSSGNNKIQQTCLWSTFQIQIKIDWLIEVDHPSTFNGFTKEIILNISLLSDSLSFINLHLLQTYDQPHPSMLSTGDNRRFVIHEQ